MNDVKSTYSSLEQMLRDQIIDRGITDLAVIEALRATPRELFFAPDDRDAAYADRASSIGHGQTISQPYIVALMSSRLELSPSCRVLEIGAGSGYQTAILARLAKEVWTIERIKPLLDIAWERLMRLNLRNIHFRFGDGLLGWPEQAPFDRILIAAAARTLPRQLLLSQLVDGGQAVLPVGDESRQMLVHVRRVGSTLVTAEFCPCRFVDLVGELR